MREDRLIEQGTRVHLRLYGNVAAVLNIGDRLMY